jgi:hypothetical protein
MRIVQRSDTPVPPRSRAELGHPSVEWGHRVRVYHPVLTVIGIRAFMMSLACSRRSYPLMRAFAVNPHRC